LRSALKFNRSFSILLMRQPIDSPITFPEQYLRFFELFNERCYYDAHEELEDLWIMETGQERNYYKGMIMMAIALEHLQRGRFAPAQRLHRDAGVYLSEYPAVFMGIELGDFLAEMEKILLRARELAGLNQTPLTRVEEHPVLLLKTFTY
jgi:predicted metal-dependent hydrolase